MKSREAGKAKSRKSKKQKKQKTGKHRTRNPKKNQTLPQKNPKINSPP